MLISQEMRKTKMIKSKKIGSIIVLLVLLVFVFFVSKVNAGSNSSTTGESSEKLTTLSDFAQEYNQAEKCGGEKKTPLPEDKKDDDNSDKSEDEKADEEEEEADPVIIPDGNFYNVEQDLKGKFPAYQFSRYYSSQYYHDNGFGKGWSHTHSIVLIKKLNRIKILLPEARVIHFKKEDNRYAPSKKRSYCKLKEEAKYYKLTYPSGIEYVFLKNVRQNRIPVYEVRNLEGLQKRFYYDEISGLLKKVEDRFDNSLQFEYNRVGFITGIEDSSGRIIKYTYKAMPGPVSSCLKPDGGKVEYRYNSRGRLAKKIYFDGTVLNCLYDEKDRIIKQGVDDNFIFFFKYDDAKKEIKFFRKDRLAKTYHYNDNNDITQIIFSDNSKIEKVYNDNNKIIKFIDQEGNITQFSYDKNGNIKKKILPDNAIYGYEYTKHNRLKKEICPLSRSTSYTYSAQGKLRSKIDAGGNKTTYEYNKNGFLEKEVFPDGGVILYERDDKGNILKENNNGIISQYECDERGNITKTINPSGLVVEIIYNFRNDPLKVAKKIDNKEYSISYEYDAFGNISKIIDPKDRVTTFKTAKGIFNRIAAVKDPLGNTINFEYDEFGNKISYQDRRGNIWQYEYDVLDRLTRVIDPKENKILAEYDSRGNIKTRINRDGLITHYFYDSLNRIKMIKIEDKIVANIEYDLTGNITRVVDGEGNSTSYKYNTLAKITEVQDAEGNITKYTYDSRQRVTGITDGNGNTTYYAYNKSGNLLSITNPLALKTIFKYDNCGRVKEKILPDESVFRYNYDKFERILKVEYPDDTIIYTYDAVDNVHSVENRTAKITYVYDELNRMIKEHNSFNNKTIIYAYDQEDNRISLVLNDNYKIDYLYDELNRLTQIANNDLCTKYTYTPADKTLSKLYPNGMNINYLYDKYIQLEKIEVKKPVKAHLPNFGTTSNGASNQIIDYFKYDYDKAGNIIHEQTPELQKRYTYDKTYQLLKETIDYQTQDNQTINQISVSLKSKVYGLRSEVSYSYDKAGNRLTETIGDKTIDYAYNQANQLIKRGNAEYEYDKLGNLVKEISPEEAVVYNYNPRNFLTSVDYRQTTVDYSYDAIGRRLSRNKTKYVYDGFRRIREIEPRLIGQREINYLHGRFMDELISRTASPTTYYYQDVLNNVRGLTDNQAEKIQAYSYTAFGEPEVTTYQTKLGFIERKIDQPFLYNGRPLDRETKLYYYRLRDYNPETGRFLQPDPLGQIPGPNIYAYVNNNPVNWVDPWGLDRGEAIAPFKWWDITSWLLPGTNYGGVSKSGPGKPTSELDEAFKRHDESLEKLGHNWWKFGNKEVREAHEELIKDWSNYAEEKYQEQIDKIKKSIKGFMIKETIKYFF